MSLHLEGVQKAKQELEQELITVKSELQTEIRSKNIMQMAENRAIMLSQAMAKFDEVMAKSAENQRIAERQIDNLQRQLESHVALVEESQHRLNAAINDNQNLTAFVAELTQETRKSHRLIADKLHAMLAQRQQELEITRMEATAAKESRNTAWRELAASNQKPPVNIILMDRPLLPL